MSKFSERGFSRIRGGYTHYVYDRARYLKYQTDWERAVWLICCGWVIYE